MMMLSIRRWLGEIGEGSYVSNLINPLPEPWEKRSTYLMAHDERNVEEIYKSIKDIFNKEAANLLGQFLDTRKGSSIYRGPPSSIDVRIMKKIEGNEELEQLRQQIIGMGKKYGTYRESEDYPESAYWRLTHKEREEFTNLLFDPSNLHINDETIVYANVNTPLGKNPTASRNLMDKLRSFLNGYTFTQYFSFSPFWNGETIQCEHVCDYPYEIWAGKKVVRDNLHACGNKLSELEEEAKENGIGLREISCKFSSTGYCNEACLPKGGVLIQSLPPQGISTTSWMEKRDNSEEIHEILPPILRGRKIHRVYVRIREGKKLIREEEIHE